MDNLFSQLRAAIEADSRGQAPVAEAAEIHPNNLNAFMKGRRSGLSVETVERIAFALGYAVKLVPINQGEPLDRLTAAQRRTTVQALEAVLKVLNQGTNK